MASNKYVRYKKVMQSLCPSEIEMYREAFNFFDKSKKGYIVAADFHRALTNMRQNPSQEEVEGLVKEYDVNGDGKITFEELVVSVVRRKEQKDDDTELQKLFKKHDEDNDGALTRDELLTVLTSLGQKVSPSDIEEIMEEFDTNQSSVIQYSEFMKMMKNL